VYRASEGGETEGNGPPLSPPKEEAAPRSEVTLDRPPPSEVNVLSAVQKVPVRISEVEFNSPDPTGHTK